MRDWIKSTSSNWWFKPLEKYSSDWIIIPTIGENKTCSKAPTSLEHLWSPGSLWHSISQPHCHCFEAAKDQSKLANSRAWYDPSGPTQGTGRGPLGDPWGIPNDPRQTRPALPRKSAKNAKFNQPKCRTTKTQGFSHPTSNNCSPNGTEVMWVRRPSYWFNPPKHQLCKNPQSGKHMDDLPTPMIN